MILGNISLEPCISNRILLAALVVQNWDLSLVILWGLVKRLLLLAQGLPGQSNFSFDSSSAVKLVSRFTGAILEELVVGRVGMNKFI